MSPPANQRPSNNSSFTATEDFADFSNATDVWGVQEGGGGANESTVSVTTDTSFPNLDYSDVETWAGESAAVPVVTPSRKKINERESSWFNDEPSIKGIPRKNHNKQKQLWFPLRLERLGEDDVESIAESIALNTSLSLASNTADASRYDGVQTRDVARGFVEDQKRMEVLEYSRRLLKGRTISEVKDGIVNEVKGLIATRAPPHHTTKMTRRASIGCTSDHSRVSNSGYEAAVATAVVMGTPRRQSLGYALGAVAAVQSSPVHSSRRGSWTADDNHSSRTGSSLMDAMQGYPRSQPSPRASPYGSSRQRIRRSHSTEAFSRLQAAITLGQQQQHEQQQQQQQPQQQPRLVRKSSLEDNDTDTMRTTHTVDTLEKQRSTHKTRRSSIANNRSRGPTLDASLGASTTLSSAQRRSSSTLTTAESSFLHDSRLSKATTASTKGSNDTVNSRIMRHGARRSSLTGHPSMSIHPSCSTPDLQSLDVPSTTTKGPELVLDRAPAGGRSQLLRSNSGSTLRSSASRSSASSSASSRTSASPRGVATQRLPPPQSPSSSAIPLAETSASHHNRNHHHQHQHQHRRTPRRLSQHASMGGGGGTTTTRTPSPSPHTRSLAQPRPYYDSGSARQQRRSSKLAASVCSVPEPAVATMVNRSRQARRSSMNV